MLSYRLMASNIKRHASCTCSSHTRCCQHLKLHKGQAWRYAASDRAHQACRLSIPHALCSLLCAYSCPLLGSHLSRLRGHSKMQPSRKQPNLVGRRHPSGCHLTAGSHHQRGGRSCTGGRSSSLFSQTSANCTLNALLACTPLAQCLCTLIPDRR